VFERKKVALAFSMSNRNLVDELETAFQDCLSLLTNHDFFNTTDSEETRASIEQSIQKFLELARELETFFLQRRFILSLHKPEQIIKEDIMDLRAELQRKEALLMKHHENLQKWQLHLNRAQGGQQQQPQAQSHPAQQGQQPQGQGQGGANPVATQVMPPPPAQGSYPQGPLAFLEQTTSNIGMPERR